MIKSIFKAVRHQYLVFYSDHYLKTSLKISYKVKDDWAAAVVVHFVHCQFKIMLSFSIKKWRLKLLNYFFITIYY